ncbi:S-adenosyl-L-methionine-dependent methyltransferase [Gloeophyllum trabeum ATCC 11539]|uniref:S-adenosyl-L-methionine-dependent methyltransferase n=1 Tax=Gloeophyllum trabeum (strain ATCC 11539 / FP-39264 / Madison 617) TaxID=670483 RepID=S7PV96_GLOTA|nr:S-adenosyl-L-methionine-dependent methyltransferase [Gloeophyllum trabeum ATCC 11539]EPQ51546.1 S-adenosyl-L-methionine-dependent methyltransferase [Gloeophyllum trabeum ATCC 11539]
MSSASTPLDAAPLNALVDVISSALKDIVTEYSKIGSTVPTLDETRLGPFDNTEQYNLRLNRAVQIVEGACAQLCATVARPSHYLTNKAYCFYECSCLEVAFSARISDILLDKPNGMHVSELSKASGVEVGKLGRVLRLLATQHCYREVEPDVFANNRLSMKLLSNDPIGNFIGHITDECMKGGSHLWTALSDPEWGTSYEVENTAFKKAMGLSIFNWYNEDPRGKSVHERFNQGMIGLGEFNGRGLLAKAYPWETLPEDTVLCDVGGGNGHASLIVLKSFPHVKAIIQDQEHVVSTGKALWSRECPGALEKDRVAFVPIDFFRDTPVRDCDIYYARHVLHDWPDAECVKILANIRKAMKPSSRVLIHEYIYQNVSPTRTQAYTLDKAPEPLLPNFGAGRFKVYTQDINMMALMNAKERSPEMFIELGEQVGLKFVKFHNSGETGLVEFALA